MIAAPAIQGAPAQTPMQTPTTAPNGDLTDAARKFEAIFIRQILSTRAQERLRR